MCGKLFLKPHVTSGTTKTVVPKIPKNSGSTPTPCLDKAVLAQGGGGVPAGDRWGGQYDGENPLFRLEVAAGDHDCVVDPPPPPQGVVCEGGIWGLQELTVLVTTFGVMDTNRGTGAPGC